MRWIVVASIVAAAQTAHADRCADGIAALGKNDLSRAALYLDGCDDTEPKATRELHKQLEASNLAVLEVVSNPAGLEAEIDALPGEHFTTPATLYVKAGKHEVRAGAVTNTVTTEPHKRSVVILDAGAPKTAPPPKDGVADFRDDAPTEDPPVGPPPVVQHKAMMPCKYTNTCTESGDQIDDPLARADDRPPPRPPASDLGARAGAGAFVGGVGPSAALVWTAMAPWEDATAETHPFLMAGRADWSRRRGGSSVGMTLTFGKVIAAPDTAWLSVGAGARIGAGLNETFGAMSTNTNESAGVATVDLALRRLPVTLGARYEQGVAKLPDGSYEHAVIFELGIGWRTYR